jgi:signal recognition particle subunit SRP54
MFDKLTERLSSSLQQLRGKGRLTEDAVRETLREVRIALLEADVALPVVQQFIAEVGSWGT